MLPLILALAGEPSAAASVDVGFDMTRLQACATSEREAARACLDSAMTPEAKAALLSTDYDDIHRLHIADKPFVSTLEHAWPSAAAAELGATLKAGGHVFSWNDPIFVIVQDDWLVQNHCDLDEAARVADEKLAKQAVDNVLTEGLKHPTPNGHVVSFKLSHTFKPRCTGGAR